MQKIKHQQLNRWFVSEINFKSSAAMIRCKHELEDIVEKPITVSPSTQGVCLEGNFCFSDFEGKFHSVVKQHAVEDQNYNVKSIFHDPDGYFGGWVERHNTTTGLRSGVNLNAEFEEF